MSWCPKCGTEFDTRGGVCNKCEVELVDQVKKIEDKTFVKLETVNQPEGEIVESLLEAHDIIVLKNYSGPGDTFHTGRSRLYGVDIFVPATQLETAREIMEAIPESTRQ